MIEAVDAFRDSGILSARLDAEVLLSHCLGVSRPELYRDLKEPMPSDKMEMFRLLVDRRRKGEPVAYIRGCKEFWSMQFRVTPEVLIPRPDTEILVEEVIDFCRRDAGRIFRILEIGTGSGAVSIAIASELNNARITATDISEKALSIARENAVANGVGDRIIFLHGSLFEPVRGLFDIVVSNPPYVSRPQWDRLCSEIRFFEPEEALLAGPEGTEFHCQIANDIRDYLESGGWLLMEMGNGQWERLRELLEEAAVFDEIGFREDYAGIPRVLKARKKQPCTDRGKGSTADGFF